METVINLRLDSGVDPMIKLRQTLNQIKPGGHLTIVIERTDAHEADEVFELLDEFGFDYQPKGDEDNRYLIKAKKLVH